MKRILFLTPFCPSRIAGGHNYTRLLLKKLADEGYLVDLLYCKYSKDPFYENPDTTRIQILRVCKINTFVKFLNAIKVPILHPIFTIRFSWLVLFFLKWMDFKKNYDLVYLDHPQMYIYGLFFKQKKVLMAHDVMAQRYDRASSRFVQKIVKIGERFFMSMKNCVVFSFSEKDQLLVKKYYGISSEKTNFFIDSQIRCLPPPSIQNYFVFFGKWDRDDNLDGMKWFFNEVYPKINARIKIIGSAMPREYQIELKKKPFVEYLGFIDNPYDVIANAKAVLAPLFTGAGVKVKVIESLACGTPVVGNDISFEGISNEWNDFMLAVNSAKEFVCAMQKINMDKDERTQFRTNFLRKYDSQSFINYLRRINV